MEQLLNEKQKKLCIDFCKFLNQNKNDNFQYDDSSIWLSIESIYSVICTNNKYNSIDHILTFKIDNKTKKIIDITKDIRHNNLNYDYVDVTDKWKTFIRKNKLEKLRRK